MGKQWVISYNSPRDDRLLSFKVKHEEPKPGMNALVYRIMSSLRRGGCKNVRASLVDSPDTEDIRTVHRSNSSTALNVPALPPPKTPSTDDFKRVTGGFPNSNISGLRRRCNYFVTYNNKNGIACIFRGTSYHSNFEDYNNFKFDLCASLVQAGYTGIKFRDETRPSKVLDNRRFRELTLADSLSHKPSQCDYDTIDSDDDDIIIRKAIGTADGIHKTRGDWYAY